mmetsp:Transcript_1551/g.2526  ORF Transcript_1551/g.2526 Transcript_1551/m.2526 type:complete len:82 (+) Transcript_1551:1-246(+)
MERLGLPGTIEFAPHDWATHNLLQLFNGDLGQVLVVGAEKADFRDLFLHQHHAQDLHRLGLVHVDQVCVDDGHVLLMVMCP